MRLDQSHGETGVGILMNLRRFSPFWSGPRSGVPGHSCFAVLLTYWFHLTDVGGRCSRPFPFSPRASLRSISSSATTLPKVEMTKHSTQIICQNWPQLKTSPRKWYSWDMVHSAFRFLTYLWLLHEAEETSGVQSEFKNTIGMLIRLLIDFKEGGCRHTMKIKITRTRGAAAS